jgi:hypothetical protein
MKKYELKTLSGGWAVVMSTSNRIVEMLPTEIEASVALEQFEAGLRFVKVKKNVWVIGEYFVTEAEIGGVQLGEVHQLDMNQFNVVDRYSQEELDALIGEDFEE